MDATSTAGTPAARVASKSLGGTATEFVADCVTVDRGDPFTSFEELQNDAGVAAVAADVAAYCDARPGAIFVPDLMRYLVARHSGVTGPTADTEVYKFAIDPQGNVYEICCLIPTIEIDDGGDSPIVVAVTLITEL